MNNIINMVNYYLVHKNADDSIIEYIKNKLNNSNLEELILIQIELLYTDPSDKLVNNLVNYINNKINIILKESDIYEYANLISLLKAKISDKENMISNLEKENKDIFSNIKTKDLNKDNVFDYKDSDIAATLINQTQNNIYSINKIKSEITSINIWLKNLENSFNKKINNANIEELLDSYIKELKYLNRDEYINKFMNITSNKIEDYILKSNIIDTITNVIPELDRIYNINSNEKNEIYKLLDYYIDLVEHNLKNKINKLDYEEKLLIKEKIIIICDEILNNDTQIDDFKVLVINNYLKYL